MSFAEAILFIVVPQAEAWGFQDFFETVCGKILIPEDELQHALDAVASNPSKLSKAPFACGKEELAKVVFHQ